MSQRPLFLGKSRPISAQGASASPLGLPPHHFTTHAAVVGMTGSGKTGLVMVLVEEALRSGVPVLMIDIKGDLPNLFLTFPKLEGAAFEPWVDAIAAERQGKTKQEVANGLAQKAKDGLAGWGLGEADIGDLRAKIAPRLLTPGTTAGEPLHVLSSLEIRSPMWDEDEEVARDALSASISLLLRLVDRDADPARSRDHVLLSHLAERRLVGGKGAGLSELLADLISPPIDRVGAMAVDDFLAPKERKELAQQLNALLASPTFSAWQKGAPLDIDAWLAPKNGKTPAVIVSVAHLDDAERNLVLGLLFDQILAWVRGLPGTSELRALVVLDEVFGFLPPHPANPPTKRPLLALLKQARAFGVGLVLATQNPMDLDYKALSNAGAWFVGRLQTDGDRARIVEALAGAETGAGGLDPGALGDALKALPQRTFFVRDVHHAPPSFLLETRWALSWLRGPMTRKEILAIHRSIAPSAPSAPAAPSADRAMSDGSSQKQGDPAPLPASTIAAPPATSSAAPAASTSAAPSPNAPPSAPEGFAVRFAPPPAGARSWSYSPWIAATVTVHVRDAKLGITVNRSAFLAAPLTSDGRPDGARAAEIDPSGLATVPAPGGTFQPIPDALSKKAGREAAVKALREHVYRTFQVQVDLHPGLGLARGDRETRETFVSRCQAEAGRRLGAEEQTIVAEHAPEIAKLNDRLVTLQSKLASGEAELANLPGAMGAAIIGLAFGKRSAQRTDTERNKVLARVEKIRSDVVMTEAELRAAIASRDARVIAARQKPARVASEVETRTLAPKKADVDVSGITLAWGVEP